MLPDARIERIAFVTRRFADLQGLRMALGGILLLQIVVAWSFMPPEFQDPLRHLGWVFGFWIGGNFGLLDGYYTRNFGRAPLVAWKPSALFYAVSDPGSVQTNSGRRHPGPELVHADAAGPLLVYSALTLEAVKGTFYPGGLSLVAAAVAGHAAWVLFRDWRYRPYYLLALAAGVLGLAMTSTIPAVVRMHGPLRAEIATAYAYTFAMLGLALVVVGLLNHRLLWRSMVRPDAPVFCRPDRVMSGLRTVIAGTCLAVVVGYITIAGWPVNAMYLQMVLFVALAGVGIVCSRRWTLRVRAAAQRAAAARARMSAKQLEAKVDALRERHPEPAEDAEDVETPVPRLPRVDTAGYLLLPLAIAVRRVAGRRNAGLAAVARPRGRKG